MQTDNIWRRAITKIQKSSSSDIWIYFVIIAILLSIYFLIVFIFRYSRRRSLSKMIDKIFPKTFDTSYDIDKRCENIEYYCKIINYLLAINEQYSHKHLYSFGKLSAYRDELRSRFIDLFNYHMEIIRLDYLKYKGDEIPIEDLYKVRGVLYRSFVVSYKRLRTYDALDSFALFSDMILGYLTELQIECQYRCVSDAQNDVCEMLNVIQEYQSHYKVYSGIRKKVYKSCENTGTETMVTYQTLGHTRYHVIEVYKAYVAFIENYYRHVQVFYNCDLVLKPYV